MLLNNYERSRGHRPDPQPMLKFTKCLVTFYCFIFLNKNLSGYSISTPLSTRIKVLTKKNVRAGCYKHSSGFTNVNVRDGDIAWIYQPFVNPLLEHA